MLDIRQDQVDQLRVCQETFFAGRLVEALQRDFADARAMPCEVLQQEVSEQVAQATAYGLETEWQLANYVITAWILGADFDTKLAAANQVLNADDYTADEKAKWLEVWTKEILARLKRA